MVLGVDMEAPFCCAWLPPRPGMLMFRVGGGEGVGVGVATTRPPDCSVFCASLTSPAAF